MSNSINTNVGAMVALSTLRTTQAALGAASKQVQTGYRVSDAADDASTFSVAQGIRGNLQAFQAVQGSLANGVGLGSVTQAALTNISNLLGSVQAKFTQLLDGSISAQQNTIYLYDAREMMFQIQNFISQANYNGTNLLSSGSASKDVPRRHQRLDADDVRRSRASLPPSTRSSRACPTADRRLASEICRPSGRSSTRRSAPTRPRPARSSFNPASSIRSSTRRRQGFGAIVDADVGKASASVQALQVRQQLGIQSLSIANQQPSVLLGLFR